MSEVEDDGDPPITPTQVSHPGIYKRLVMDIGTVDVLYGSQCQNGRNIPNRGQLTTEPCPKACFCRVKGGNQHNIALMGKEESLTCWIATAVR